MHTSDKCKKQVKNCLKVLADIGHVTGSKCDTILHELDDFSAALKLSFEQSSVGLENDSDLSTGTWPLRSVLPIFGMLSRKFCFYFLDKHRLREVFLSTRN